MLREAGALAALLGMTIPAMSQTEPPGLLDQIVAKLSDELDRLPDYVCTQSIQRATRSSRQREWTQMDTLRLDVAMVGRKELYARAGAARFQDQPLSEMVRRGTISTGQLGLLADHVFKDPSTTFTYRGVTERAGRPAHEFDYDVAPGNSRYRLGFGGEESLVGFQGAFWIDVDTLDLIRLDVQAYDIPENLGLAQASTTLSYARIPIGSEEVLLPQQASLSVVTVDGIESLNRTRLADCRRYQVESTISYAGVSDAPPQEPAGTSLRAAPEVALPAGAVLELILESELDPASARPGDTVTARVQRATAGDQPAVVQQGSIAVGRLVRLQKETIPFTFYIVGIAFDEVQVEGQTLPLAATMLEAGPTSGLMRQSRRMDPTFSRKRKAGMEILVRETQQGQGILHWDGRKGAIPRGLKMKWQVIPEHSR